MQDKVLEQLKKKYEYLDFNDTVVLSCLNDAIRYMETVCPDTLSNKSIFMMEIEYHFLHYLVLEMQKGNKEIYDAVSIGLEPTFDFFKRKRRDLITGIDNQEEKILYDLAFKRMIDSYTERQSLSSLFIKHLISTFKTRTNKTGDVILMKYVIKENSLFKTFDNYSKEIVEFVIDTFKNELGTTSLFIRQFGPNFDGVNAKKDLAYYEKMRLEPALIRFEKRLEYVKLVLASGKSFEEIKDKLRNKKDYEIDKIVVSYQKPEEKVVIFKSLNQIRQSLNVNDKDLDELLYSLPSSDIKLVFKYTYGVGVKSLEDYQIMDMLRIDQKKYNEYLKTACCEISRLVKIKKAEKPKIEKVKVAAKPVIKPVEKTKIIAQAEKKEKINEPVHPEVVERKSEEIVKVIEESVKLAEKKDAKDMAKNKRQRYIYFTERFYPENATEEEKEAIDKKVYEIFYATKAYEKGKKAARKLYGDGLNNPATGSLSREENGAFNGLVLKIRKELSEKEKRRPGKSRKKRFIEYLYTDNMTDEEKQNIEILLKERLEILRKKSPKSFEFAQKLYGENLDQELSNYKIERDKNSMFTSFVLNVKTILSKKDINVIEKNNYEKEEQNSSLKSNFYENFYIDDMTGEKKEEVRDKVRKALFFHKDTRSHEVLYEFYDENLNLIDGKEISRLEKTTITRFVGTIKRTMTLDLNLWFQQTKRVFECEYFFEYFYTNDMSSDEKEDIKEEILKIIDYLKLTNVETYKCAAILYGETLTEKRKNIELDPTEKANFGYFVSRVRKQLGKEIPDIKEQYITYQRRPKMFSMYFYKYGMTEEEKELQNQRVQEILKHQQKSILKGYELAKKLYGDDLNSELTPCEFTNTEKASFRQFVINIKEILAGKKEIDYTPKYKKSNSKKQTFFDYFYTERMTEEEKEDIRIKVRAFIISSKLNGVQAVYKLYGPNLDTLNDIKYDSIENANMSWLRKKIRDYLAGEEVKNNHKPTRTNLPTYFDYFYTEGMTEEEKEVVRQKVLTFVQSSELKGAQVVYKLYGQNLDSLNDVIMTSMEKNNFHYFKGEVKRYVFGLKRGNYQRNNLPVFFDYFYTVDMSEEEKQDIREYVLAYLNKSNLFGVKVVYKLYGQNLDKFNDSIKLSPKEKSDFSSIKGKIKEYIVNQKNSENLTPNEIVETGEVVLSEANDFPDIEPLEEEIISEVEDVTILEEFPTINVEELVEDSKEVSTLEEKINNKEQEEINYLDSIILKAYDCFEDHDLILSKLKISQSIMIECYIRHLSHFNDLDEILDYIIETDSNSISKILSSEYFSNFGKYLTEKEQEVIYLLLLSKQNKKIDISMISMITGIDLETLNNYKVMTPDDELNKLYEYIKR